MLEKSKGIVLQSFKYGDSSLIAHIYTEKLGRRAFIFKAVRSRKAKQKANLIQPLIILNLDFYLKEHKDILMVKEFSRSKVFNDFPYNPIKSTQAIFISEVLSKTLQEEYKSPDLYEFLVNFIDYFDLKKENYANLHLSFLMKFTKYLGISPGTIISKDEFYFDLDEACFLKQPPLHKSYCEPVLSSYIFKLLSENFESSSALKFNREVRNKLLEIIIRFYSIHNYNIEKLNSTDILKEIFIS